jgi:hypothetical protein
MPAYGLPKIEPTSGVERLYHGWRNGKPPVRLPGLRMPVYGGSAASTAVRSLTLDNRMSFFTSGQIPQHASASGNLMHP